jgi:hypothetical protein
MFQTILKTNPDVDNVVIYQRVKFEIEISYIQGYIKIIKSERF